MGASYELLKENVIQLLKNENFKKEFSHYTQMIIQLIGNECSIFIYIILFVFLIHLVLTVAILMILIMK